MAVIKTISTTEDILNNINFYVKKGFYKDVSTFFNMGATLLIKTHKNNNIVDFLHYVFPGVFFFLGCVGTTLYLGSLFFYILTGISGMYLMVFVYLFYDKYKGVKVKHGDND